MSNKDKKLNFRVTDYEKKELKKLSEEMNMTISEYVRECVFGDEVYVDHKRIAMWAQNVQEILNILSEHKIEDERIKRLGDELWQTILL